MWPGYIGALGGVVDVVTGVVEFDIGETESPGLSAVCAAARPPMTTTPARKLDATSLRIMMTLHSGCTSAHHTLYTKGKGHRVHIVRDLT